MINTVWKKWMRTKVDQVKLWQIVHFLSIDNSRKVITVTVQCLCTDHSIFTTKVTVSFIRLTG